MREHDPADDHPGIEELQARPRALVQVHVEVGEGERLVLDRPGGLGKQTLVQVHVGEVLQVLLDRLEADLVLAHAVDLAVGLGRFGQSLERVEDVKGPIALGLADQPGRAALVGAHFRDISGVLALRKGQRVDDVALVGAEQASPPPAHLLDRPDDFLVLVGPEDAQLHPGNPVQRGPLKPPAPDELLEPLVACQCHEILSQFALEAAGRSGRQKHRPRTTGVHRTRRPARRQDGRTCFPAPQPARAHSPKRRLRQPSMPTSFSTPVGCLSIRSHGPAPSSPPQAGQKDTAEAQQDERPRLGDAHQREAIILLDVVAAQRVVEQGELVDAA